MTRSARVYLSDIVESIDKILFYVEAVDEQAFLASSQLQDAVARRLEIIGEAAKQLPGAMRGAHPEVRWQDVTGLRDILIHAYSRVDVHRIWTIVRDHLPAFREHAVRLLEKTPV